MRAPREVKIARHHADDVEALVIKRDFLVDDPRVAAETLLPQRVTQHDNLIVAGLLVFQKERWYQRFLHNETANQIQRRLQFDGLNSMILPVRIFDTVQEKI